jgi:hypothetical protein
LRYFCTGTVIDWSKNIWYFFRFGSLLSLHFLLPWYSTFYLREYSHIDNI